MKTRILDAPLSVDRCLDAVKHNGAGALVVFVGTVRDHAVHDGATVSVNRLEYEAYAEMAARVIDDLVTAVCAEHPGVRAAVEHRTGSLATGDLAVVVATSAPHRGPAFAACQALIDRLKADAPIWKREHGNDGITWVGLGP